MKLEELQEDVKALVNMVVEGIRINAESDEDYEKVLGSAAMQLREADVFNGNDYLPLRDDGLDDEDDELDFDELDELDEDEFEDDDFDEEDDGPFVIGFIEVDSTYPIRGW